MILYIENPKVSTQKLLQLINEFSKVAGYKINIKKSVAFLYTNKISERESEKMIPLKITLGKKQKQQKTMNKLNQGGERPIR